MILVAGGSGRLGTLVVERALADRGLEVRVLTRDPAERATSATPRPTSSRETCGTVRASNGPWRGSASSCLRSTGSRAPAESRLRRSIVTATRTSSTRRPRAGADVVLLSVVGAAEDHPMELFRAKHDAEVHLRASSVRWTIVRATAFVELWADIMRRPIVFGRGTNPINFVSVRDVAGAVVQAVVDPGLRGQVLEIGGPQNMTFNELAALLAEVRGRPARVRHVPRGLAPGRGALQPTGERGDRDGHDRHDLRCTLRPRQLRRPADDRHAKRTRSRERSAKTRRAARPVA